MTEHTFIILLPWHTDSNNSSFNEDEEESWHTESNVEDEGGDESWHHLYINIIYVLYIYS